MYVFRFYYFFTFSNYKIISFCVKIFRYKINPNIFYIRIYYFVLTTNIFIFFFLLSNLFYIQLVIQFLLFVLLLLDLLHLFLHLYQYHIIFLF